jgi:NADPH:quinone reductase-like Zn-dependent oxidoreductase
MSGNALVSMALQAEGGAWKSFAAVRGQQLVALLLTYIPLAERMLLYHVAMTAWIMLPERGLLEKTLLSTSGRLGLK